MVFFQERGHTGDEPWQHGCRAKVKTGNAHRHVDYVLPVWSLKYGEGGGDLGYEGSLLMGGSQVDYEIGLSPL